MPCDLHSCPTRRSSDLAKFCKANLCYRVRRILLAIAIDRTLEPHVGIVSGSNTFLAAAVLNVVSACCFDCGLVAVVCAASDPRSEEHTSELQSPCNLVCRVIYTLALHDALPI